LLNLKACKDMPGIRFASRFGSLRVLAVGYNNSESLYVMSDPIISRGICAVALAECGLARVMPRRSGTS
jgi:hypothetical protein